MEIERIKYLRNDRVPFACMYSKFNKETSTLEFGWSLCCKNDKFIKKEAVKVAKENININAPHSIKKEMDIFIDSFRTSKIKKSLLSYINDGKYEDAYDLIVKHGILIEAYSNEMQLIGYVFGEVPIETVTLMLQMWAELKISISIEIDAM